MPPTRGTIRASKGYSIFRIVFGLFFIGLGLQRHFADGASGSTGLITLGLGLLFFGYGVAALFFGQALGTKVELDTPAPASPTERLAEITQLKTGGLISDAEYEQKRQEILNDL